MVSICGNLDFFCLQPSRRQQALNIGLPVLLGGLLVLLLQVGGELLLLALALGGGEGQVQLQARRRAHQGEEQPQGHQAADKAHHLVLWAEPAQQLRGHQSHAHR